ncbi:sensor histidine kinase [Amycolatopsis pigmentata]|uniref:histidine kinase n=1 Tax=Amycolatopsis pigmentata TaxID=450801 RepID=A0ABW5FUT4_9PSEU
MVGDSLIALLLLLFDGLLFSHGANSQGGQGPEWYVVLPMDLAITLPLVFRRKYPLWVASLVLVISIPHTLLKLGLGGMAAPLIALYSVAVYVNRRQAVYYLIPLVAVVSVDSALVSTGEEWLSIIVEMVLVAFTWVLAEFVGARRAYRAELDARLHLLETERDQATKIAVAEERSQIARELHDVVAHAVSVIVVQADGASFAVRSQPELAERAVQTISRTGREALAELRRLLQVLRSDDSPGSPNVPHPDAASLAELAERIRVAGIPVELDIAGSLGGLPAGVSLGLYRIVQESLTNTLKHAGQGARARVRIRRTEDVIEVDVTDDGAGRAPALARSGPLPGGNGVIGMRERAHIFGGSLEAGPHSSGGWRVHATLPTKLTP